MIFEIISEEELIKTYRDKRPKGKWKVRRLKISEKCFHEFYNCSICGEEAFFDEDGDYLTNYCPHCGADMRGKE